jgi:hypothetical protein
METIEAKIKVKLSEAIEKTMDDGELVDELDMYFPDEFASRMADAALSVLLGMQDTQKYLKEQGLMKS